MNLLGVISFPGDALATTPKCVADVGDLRFLLEIKHGMEDGVAQRKFFRNAIGEDPRNLILEVLPLSLPPKIIDHEKPAVE